MRVFFCGVGSKRPVGINIEKAWNLTFAYFLVRGFCKTLPTRISKQRPRDMSIVVEHNELNTPWGIYRSLALG